MSGSTLSDYIIFEIVKLLPLDDVRSLRPVCRTAAIVGAPFLVREVHISSSMNSTEGLEAIGRHPQLALFVKAPVCHRYGLSTTQTDRDVHHRYVEHHSTHLLSTAGERLSSDQGGRLYASYMEEIVAHRV